MNSFEINKIIAAIVLTIVIVFGVNKLADAIYSVKAPEGNTYNIVTETKEISKSDTVNVGSNANVSALLTLGNIDHGKMVFKKCAACHSVSKGGGNKIGPALWGVIGRKVGSISDYKYSKAMSKFGKNWNFETMNAFLIKPKDYVKGTKMAYAGLKKEKDRASIILYLNEQGDSPLPLP
jgi:cytochrome c